MGVYCSLSVLVISLVLFSLHCFAVSELPNQEFTNKQVEKFCNSLRSSNSLFIPVHCQKPGENLGRIGKMWAKQNKLDSFSATGPILLVPGFAGSGLKARLSKQNTAAWYCFKKWDWFRIWLSLEELLVQDCWADNLKLRYDEETNTYQNAEGVEIDGIEFGGLQGVDFLDYFYGIPVPITSYFAEMIASFEAVGFTPGKDLRGVPYDWRLPPDNHLSDFYPRFQSLVEETYELNGQTSVHLITHSLGGPVTLYFLNSMPRAWKQK